MLQAAQLESRTSIPTPQPTPAFISPFSFLPSKPTARSTSGSSASAPLSSSSAPKPDLAPLGIAPPPISRTALGLWGGSQSGNQEGYLYGNAIGSAGAMALAPGAAAPPPSSVVGVVDQKARKKVMGREKKLMGDMWLLTGRLTEAIAW